VGHELEKGDRRPGFGGVIIMWCSGKFIYNASREVTCNPLSTYGRLECPTGKIKGMDTCFRHLHANEEEEEQPKRGSQNKGLRMTVRREGLGETGEEKRNLSSILLVDGRTLESG